MPFGYSQFNIIFNIVWHSPRHDEYSWTIRDQTTSKDPAFKQVLASHDPEVLATDDFNATIPKLGVMKHGYDCSLKAQRCIYQEVLQSDRRASAIIALPIL
jgi:hypothetical protein